MFFNSQDVAVTAVSLLVFSLLYLNRRDRQRAVKELRGPDTSSRLFGLEYDLRVGNIADRLFQWSKEFGTAYKFAGCWRETMLVTSDPRALHRVLNESVYDYPESSDVRSLFETLFGKGVLWVVGEDHKRHRRVLSPAFSLNHMRGFLPMFQQHTAHLTEKWDSELQGKSQVINIIPWLHKIALDIIGESAFNYHFGALDNKPNELTQTLYELETLGGDNLTPIITLFIALPRHLPKALASFMSAIIPNKFEVIARKYLQLSNKKAKEVMDEAGLDIHNLSGTDVGSGNERDILSVLVRANKEEDERKRLNEEEVLAQMTTLIQAGHHTSGYSLSWMFYELSAHPEDQAKVYQEIRRARQHNDGEFTSADYDSMTHLMLCLKEALRLHPVLPTLDRTAAKDDVLLLDFPVVGPKGELVTEIPVTKGQRIRMDFSSYNRLEALWGEDAVVFNPMRHVRLDNEEKKQTQNGLFANILTFSGGPKGCIGWRFALMEMQAIIVGILERYELSIPKGLEIEAANVGLIVPRVKGHEGEISTLPLRVTPRV